jgi:hypothetical protein
MQDSLTDFASEMDLKAAARAAEGMRETLTVVLLGVPELGVADMLRAKGKFRRAKGYRRMPRLLKELPRLVYG